MDPAAILPQLDRRTFSEQDAIACLPLGDDLFDELAKSALSPLGSRFGKLKIIFLMSWLAREGEDERRERLLTICEGLLHDKARPVRSYAAATAAWLMTAAPRSLASVWGTSRAEQLRTKLVLVLQQ